MNRTDEIRRRLAQQPHSRTGLSEQIVAQLEALDRLTAIREHLESILTGRAPLDPFTLEKVAGLLSVAHQQAALAWELRRREEERSGTAC